MSAAARKRQPQPSAKVVSIQAKRKGGGSYISRLNDETKKHAINAGLQWDSDDVAKLARMIAKDATTFDIAMALGRTFYSAQNARAHVGFAMRHARVLKGYM